MDDETSLWKPEEISDPILSDCDSFQMVPITYTAVKAVLRWIANVGNWRF